jgi:hypothetical protein
MKIINKIILNRNAAAWLLMVTAVALHVFDETVTDFLPFYNQLVIDLRERLGFFPAPTFSFGVWLGGLIAAIVLGYGLTPVVARGGKIIRVVVLILGVLMVVNGLLHLFTSVYFGRISPGMWSSPFLIAAALFVIIIQRMEHNHDNIEFR